MRYIIISIALLLLVSALSPAKQPAYFYKAMHGNIGSEKVTAYVMKLDTTLSGSYSYDKYGKPIEFSYRSNIKNGRVFLEEDNYRDANYKWNITGYFYGKLEGDSVISGTWISPDSSRSYPFRLAEHYPPGTAQFDIIHREDSYGNCDNPGCAVVSVTFPQMKSFTDKAVQDSVNEFIRGVILFPKIEADSTLKNGRFDSPESLISDFIKRYKADFKDLEGIREYSYNWQGDYNVAVGLNENYILGLSAYEYNYLGGAHGNYLIIHYNLDLKTGRKINLADIFAEGYEKKLNETAESIFRQQYEIHRRQNLDAAGYWFENNKFLLNDNFTLSRTGITFQYNQYEIAPYSFGAPEVFIPWEKLKIILKEDGIISRLAPQ